MTRLRPGGPTKGGMPAMSMKQRAPKLHMSHLGASLSSQASERPKAHVS